MGNKYDSVKEIVQKYGDIQLPHWISLSIWLIAVGVLLGLTIKDVTPIITNYQDEDQNVQTQIQVVKNDTLRPPGLYLCTAYKTESLSEVVSGFYNKVPFSVWPFGNRSEKCSACDLLDENSWNITSDLNMSHTIGENEIVSVIMKRLFDNQTLMDEALKPDYTTWNHPIIDAIFTYFLELADNDRWGIRNPQLANSTGSVVDDIGWPDNSKLEYLSKKFSEFMCSFLTFMGSTENYHWINTSVCSEQFLSPTFFLQRGDAVDDFKFCFALPTYLDQLGVNIQASPEFSVSAFTSLMPKGYQSTRYSIFDENPLFRYNDDLIPALYNTQNDAILNDKLANGLILKMAYSVEVSVQEQRETKHCYKDKSQLTCMNRCVIEEMVEKCSCIPFAFRFLITDLNHPYCNRTNYRNCASKLDDHKIRMENCKGQCKTACNYTSYRWQTETGMTLGIIQSSHQLPQLILKVNPVLSQFMEFTVSVRDGPQNLFSSVGGILNFYMGVSGLTIFVFLIYLVECLRRIRRLKKQEQASNQDSPIHIWHWKWFNVTANMLMKQDSKDEKSSQKRLEDLEKLLKGQREEIDKLKSEMSRKKRGRGLNRKKRGKKEEIEEISKRVMEKIEMNDVISEV